MAVVNDIAKGVLSDNIRALMETHGLSKADLSKETGIPAATIGYIVDGSTFNPRIATLLTIANYFNVSLDYLVGSPCKFSQQSIPAFSNAIDSSSIEKKTPILEWKEVKFWMKHNFDFLKNSQAQWIASTIDLSEEAFALKILHQTQGIFPKNSIILCDPLATFGSSDYILASIRGAMPTIKKVFKEHDKFFLNSVGLFLPSEEVNEENIVIAKIVECRTFFSNDSKDTL